VSLITDLQRMLKLVEEDLRTRTEDTSWGRSLQAEYQAAFERGRTGLTWTEWREGEVAQVAVAWVLATVFVRFCEDNHLLDGVWIAGSGDRRRIALDDEAHFLSQDRSRGARSWLREAFSALAKTPPGRALLDPDHNPVWTADLGDGACRSLLSFWREQDPTGALVRDLATPELDTRLLGDLYQELSELAQKKFALLQTPDFVEELILERTLKPAIEEFGLVGLRLIDPTCGSGHFLLGAFHRLLEAWTVHAPALDVRERVRLALDSIHGVDLNPFAVAIARFRLTTAALRAAGIQRLADAPAFKFHLAVGDSLIAGMHVHQGDLLEQEENPPGAAAFQYAAEDVSAHSGILERGRYHVVVGNPPYITVKDKALNAIYRHVYSTCKGKYHLSVPFMELFLALAERAEAQSPAGYVGLISDNAFMKREYGTKVIEELLSGKSNTNPVDLIDVIDTSGACIPGHGTPTVILIGRRRRPIAATVHAVLGVRGEPGTPTDPRKGFVWTEILEHLDDEEFSGTYVTVTDLDRTILARHPWSLSGGRAGDLRDAIEAKSASQLGDRTFRIGFFGIIGADDAFILPEHVARKMDADASRSLVVGDLVRDFSVAEVDRAFFPYDGHHHLRPLDEFPILARAMWPLRTELGNRSTFANRTYFSEGRSWHEWHQLPLDEGAHEWTLTLAEVATHNHVVLDREGRVFKQTAPVVKLAKGATQNDHLDILGILNSSTACFWLKEVCQQKGGDNDQPWARTRQFNATRWHNLPFPPVLPPREYATTLEALGRQTIASLPAASLRDHPSLVSRQWLDQRHREWSRFRQRMIVQQEELDWQVYRQFGLASQDCVADLEVLPDWIELGTRAFELRLAMQADDDSTWFAEFGAKRFDALPADWSPAYSAVVEARMAAIGDDPYLALLEQPVNKRPWFTLYKGRYVSWNEFWRKSEEEALSSFVLDQLENDALWRDAQGPKLLSVARLADLVRRDEQILEALRLLTGQHEVAVTSALQRLMVVEAVPFAAACRHTESGLDKRAEWELVWEMQRRQDVGVPVAVPMPPKYAKEDFRSPEFWSLRGRFNVPRERFILYPDVGQEADTSAVLGWAGWDYAEQAQALARLLVERQAEGWGADRLLPLLAGLVELQPWLDQWHADADPRLGTSPAVAIRGLLEQFMAQLGLTVDDVRAWRPGPGRRGRRPQS